MQGFMMQADRQCVGRAAGAQQQPDQPGDHRQRRAQRNGHAASQHAAQAATCRARCNFWPGPIQRQRCPQAAHPSDTAASAGTHCAVCEDVTRILLHPSVVRMQQQEAQVPSRGAGCHFWPGPVQRQRRPQAAHSPDAAASAGTHSTIRRDLEKRLSASDHRSYAAARSTSAVVGGCMSSLAWPCPRAAHTLDAAAPSGMHSLSITKLGTASSSSSSTSASERG